MSTPQTILDNLRMFMRQQSMEIPFEQLEWTASIDDLIDALSILDQAFQSTSNLTQTQMRQVSSYNWLDDVKYEMEEWMLVGEDVRESALKRRKNLTMYHLIIEPIIDSFNGVGHVAALQTVGRIVQHYINWIKDFTDFGDETDGMVANYQIKSMVAVREQARKAHKAEQKRAARKKIPSVELEILTEDDS